MNPIWVDDQGALVGDGPFTITDPGPGPSRYGASLDLLRSSGHETAFASFSFDPEEAGSVLVIPERVRVTDPPHISGGVATSVVVDDGVATWRAGFRQAMTSLQAGSLEKVVLARQMTIEAPGYIDPSPIVAKLAGAGRADYVFGVEGLVGASPELLVSLRGDRVSSLALAGTSSDPAELTSPKIIEEHRHAAESVQRSLAAGLSDIEEVSQVIVTHGAVSHLGTRLIGRARPGTSVMDLLGALHPTAAVAGTPASAAMGLIRQIEPRSRGRYSGPVGWFDTRGQGVFAIALRCGLITGNRITLYGGGGLVAGSEEEPELMETEMKMKTMLLALDQSPS
ncbi:MAG TPA: chorismate-binding protein [Acidimicrobiia bacterium]